MTDAVDASEGKRGKESFSLSLDPLLILIVS
jgi:hypothetical protein